MGESSYRSIDNTIVFDTFTSYNDDDPMFFLIKISKRYKVPSYTPIHGAVEWCKANDINPSNMSEEDEMALKLRWL